jgi:hypothetical protein
VPSAADWAEPAPVEATTALLPTPLVRAGRRRREHGRGAAPLAVSAAGGHRGGGRPQAGPRDLGHGCGPARSLLGSRLPTRLPRFGQEEGKGEINRTETKNRQRKREVEVDGIMGRGESVAGVS